MEKEQKQAGMKTRQGIYAFLVEFMTEKGFSLSIKEIADGIGMKSTSNVYEHLKLLERMGKIRMEKGKTRAISLTGYKFVKVE